jgi:hypothetical protein
VLPWDDQDVRRARGVDVAERDGVLVLVHPIRPCLAGCNSTEEAVRHGARL